MCALFSRNRVRKMFNFYNRQLLSKLIEQKVGYYAVDPIKTDTDSLYGESDSKIFKEPVVIDCLIEYQEQENTTTTNLPSTERNITVYFWKQFLIDLDVLPMKGDYIYWNDDYYEMLSPKESQYFTGKVPEFSLQQSTDDSGGSLSVVVDCVFVSKEKLGIS